MNMKLMSARDLAIQTFWLYTYVFLVCVGCVMVIIVFLIIITIILIMLLQKSAGWVRSGGVGGYRESPAPTEA